MEHLEDRVCLSTSGTVGLLMGPAESTLLHTPVPGDTEPGASVPRLTGAIAAAGDILDLGGGLVAFRTSEAAQGRDLNVDGDRLDNVLQSFDFFADTVRNSAQASVICSVIDLGNGLVAFLTSEAAQGRDLNGDGDKRDQVLQSFDATNGVVRNSGSQAIAGSVVDLQGGRVAFVTSEAEQGRRLNGDGDKLDFVLQIFDAALGVVQNTGQAVV